MDKKILICAAVIFSFAALGILAYNNLEIYREKRKIYPSDEVLENIYYALDQWLIKTGSNIRVENSFNPYFLSIIPENIVMVNSGAYSWRSTAEITEWMEKGGYCLIDIAPYNNSFNSNLLDYLSTFGIKVEYAQLSYNADSGGSGCTDFHGQTSFTVAENENILTIKDMNIF
jgi:hypothetical protein